MEDAIAFNKRGGLVTFVWHWNAPSGLLNTEAQREFDIILGMTDHGTVYSLVAWLLY